MKSSVFTLFSGTVGAGLLSLPLIFSYYGALLGGLLLMAFGLLTFHMVMILNSLIEKSGKKSYANVVSHYLGKVNGL